MAKCLLGKKIITHDGEFKIVKRHENKKDYVVIRKGQTSTGFMSEEYINNVIKNMEKMLQ